MVMGRVFAAMVAASVLCGAATGRMAEVSAAALEGAANAFALVLQMGGALCLWSGVMELMRRTGAARRLARALRPVLRRLLPRAAGDGETLAALSANMSANLLGLGNAATPPGLEAVRRMARHTGGRADRELCRLVVLNSCSIQLIPATAAALRAACGAAAPFDILGAVWLASAVSVAAGLAAAWVMERLWRD
ncbi:MAG: nucleoside recognition domain-containing protein [Oscillospiraceae bacterium]